MRIASRLFIGAGGFFALLFLIYWFMSYEPVGSTLLAAGAPACLMIGLFLARVDKKAGSRPEDRDGNHSDALGDVVAVPSASLWPVGVAFGAGTFSAGLVLGAWLAAPGAIVLVISIIAVALKGRDY